MSKCFPHHWLFVRRFPCTKVQLCCDLMFSMNKQLKSRVVGDLRSHNVHASSLQYVDCFPRTHYIDVTMSIASPQHHLQLDGLFNYLLNLTPKKTRYGDFVRGIHRWPMTSEFPHKRPITRKVFPLSDVIMRTLLYQNSIRLNYSGLKMHTWIRRLGQQCILFACITHSSLTHQRNPYGFTPRSQSADLKASEFGGHFVNMYATQKAGWSMDLWMLVIGRLTR